MGFRTLLGQSPGAGQAGPAHLPCSGDCCIESGFQWYCMRSYICHLHQQNTLQALPMMCQIPFYTSLIISRSTIVSLLASQMRFNAELDWLFSCQAARSYSENPTLIAAKNLTGELIDIAPALQSKQHIQLLALASSCAKVRECGVVVAGQWNQPKWIQHSCLHNVVSPAAAQ